MGTNGFALIVLFTLAVATGATIIALSALIGRRQAPRERGLPYECGLDPVASPRNRFSIKYFVVAVLFLVFDVEVIFFYPWALVFRDGIVSGQGMFLVIEMAVFFGILLLALVYAWGRGALDWEK
jgi:NADH-quinone oxidoreductase subunit A